MSCLFAVAGVTGNVGGNVVKSLLSAGQSVRGIVRNTNSSKAKELAAKNVQLHVASYSDVPALTAALSNVDGAFLMLPPELSSEDPDAQVDIYLAAFKEAILASKVPRVVFLSSIGAQHASNTGVLHTLYRLEKTFETIPNLPMAFVRPGYFTENLVDALHEAENDGTMTFTYNLNIKLPMVTTYDIGATVAKVLQEKFTGIRKIELEGSDRLSSLEIASIVSEILGEPVEAAAIEPDQRIPMYETVGLSHKGAVGAALLDAAADAGLIVYEGGSAEHVIGTQSFKDFAISVLK